MTAVITVTPEQFDTAMEQAVRERGPDFVYPKGESGWRLNPSGMCRYVRTDKEEPACLIGLALFKLGVPLEELRGYESSGADIVIDGTTSLGHEDVFAAATTAQSIQDEGSTWGEALRGYRKIRGI